MRSFIKNVMRCRLERLDGLCNLGSRPPGYHVFEKELLASISCPPSESQVEFRSYKEHHGTSNQQQMEAITELRLTVLS